MMLTLSQGDLEIKVLPECGGAIIEAVYRGLQFMFRPPENAIPPIFLGNETDWVRAWNGGWQPLLPNAGSEFLKGKFPQGFHGNASQSAWTVENAAVSKVDLSWRHELLNCIRKISVDESGIFVSGSIENLDEEWRKIILTEHLILGDGFFSQDSEIEVDKNSLFSDFGTDESGKNSQIVAWGDDSITDWKFVNKSTPSRFGVFSSLGGHGIKLNSADFSFQLLWDEKALPYAWVWQEMQDTQHFPWNGRYLAMGIEPSICSHGAGLGNKTSKNATKILAPREIFTWWIRLIIKKNER